MASRGGFRGRGSSGSFSARGSFRGGFGDRGGRGGGTGDTSNMNAKPDVNSAFRSRRISTIIWTSRYCTRSDDVSDWHQGASLTSFRDGFVSPRLRGRHRLRIDQPENSIFQRTHLPRKQDASWQSRRDPWTHQPSSLHHKAQRRDRGSLIQDWRQVLYRRRQAVTH